MGKTSIEWTDASWNPVVGCSEVSPGCAHCYAARLAATRLRHHHDYKGLATIEKQLTADHTKHVPWRALSSAPRWTGDVHLLHDRISEPIHWKKPRRIFVCDMSDLFYSEVPAHFIDHVWATMENCPRHTFQVLTKRPDRMCQYIVARHGYVALKNVWCGTSVENQRAADSRIIHLLNAPAAIRFLSIEPMLGRVDLNGYLGKNSLGENDAFRGIDWIIAGGESGPGARPMDPEWPRSLRDQCARAGVAFFFKQWGDLIPADQLTETERGILSAQREGEFYRVGKKVAGRLLDGREHSEFPKVPVIQ